MNDTMRDGMAEVLRLTRAGRLAEATAAIQRSLGGRPARRAPSHAPAEAAEPVEVTFRVVAEEPVSAETGAPARPGIAPALAPGPAPTGLPPRGRLVDESFTNPAGTRAYKLYVPSRYAGQAVPLVVMLHGCTQAAADCAAGTRLSVLAEEDTFLVVYPEQAAAANKSRCWNWFKPADQQRGRGEPSLIASITRQVMATYRVDARRVYVAGMSAGGAMATIMGATYPDLYAAVGVHSGLARGAARNLRSALAAMQQGGPDPGRPGDLRVAGSVPTIVFHGDRDTTVNPRNGEQVLAQALCLPPDDGLGGANGADRPVGVSQGQVPGGHAYTRSVYRNAGGQVVGEHWLVHGAGHAWSGGSSRGSFTDPQGPDASREMLRFFREHPKEETRARPAG